jgi:hypothetical protein
MSPFEVAFPGFVQACADLYRSLLPWSLILLVIGFIVEFWHGMPTPAELVKALVRVFLVILLLARSHDLVNEGQVHVKAWMDQSIPARPDNVAQRFKEKLAEAHDSQETDESFLGQIFSPQAYFEAIIFALLTLIAWLAMAVMAFVYSVQRALLLGAWSICPLLFPMLAIRPLSWVGMRHLLRILGIMLWPVGLGLAATFSEGLIDVISDGTSFANASALGALGRGFTSLLGVVVLAIWILFSTFMAPLLIQRLVVGSDGPGFALLRTGQLLTLAIPSSANFGGFYRSSVYYGHMGYSAINRLFRGGDSSTASRTSAAMMPSILSSTPVHDSKPGATATATDPTAEQAAKDIADRMKSK